MSFWNNWGEEKGCDEGYWHAHTKWLPLGLPDVGAALQCIAAGGDYFEGD